MLDQEPAVKNGRYVEGDSYKWAIAFVNRGTNTPVNLTGLTLSAELRIEDGTILMGDVTVLDPIGGKAVVDFSAHSTTQPVGLMHYRVLSKDTAGYSLTLTYGCIEVISKDPQCCSGECV